MLLSINGLPMVFAFSNRPITSLQTVSDTPKVGTGPDGGTINKHED
jgi:hypothetical protein